MVYWLLFILFLVLLLPFTIRIVEKNLEIFLFLMGIWAASISEILDIHLMMKSLKDPVFITMAVFIAGILFRWLQAPLEQGVFTLNTVIPQRLFFPIIIIALGLISSIITAIIAAIILVSITGMLRLDHKAEIRFVIITCFSIGLGASLTPIGEPLSTIATTKMDEEFFYLLKLIGPSVIPAVLLFGLLGAFLINPTKGQKKLKKKLTVESYTEITLRSVKVFLFVVALSLLGAGFEPLITTYLIELNAYSLYWINMISAILDNATLASAEISPVMDDQTIKAILMGLLISGGMLIPGNIPNIIVAGKLAITSKEWAQVGVPLGLLSMVAYFIIMLLTT